MEVEPGEKPLNKARENEPCKWKIRVSSSSTLGRVAPRVHRSACHAPDGVRMVFRVHEF